MWDLPNQNSIPPTVTDTIREQFEARYSKEAEISESVNGSLVFHQASLSAVRKSVNDFISKLPASGSIANNIRRTPHEFLQIIYRSIIQLGLTKWAPDILEGNPDSMYNLLHEHIALKTFEQVSIAHGYAHLSVNLAMLTNFGLLRRLYRSFVFSHMLKIAKLEKREEGGVAARNDLSSVYDRRNSVSTPVTIFILSDDMQLADIIHSSGLTGRKLSKTWDLVTAPVCLFSIPRPNQTMNLQWKQMRRVMHGKYIEFSRRLAVQKKSRTFSECWMLVERSWLL